MRLQRRVRVYTCQNASLLEISCTGSFSLQDTLAAMEALSEYDWKDSTYNLNNIMMSVDLRSSISPNWIHNIHFDANNCFDLINSHVRFIQLSCTHNVAIYTMRLYTTVTGYRK